MAELIVCNVGYVWGWLSSMGGDGGGMRGAGMDEGVGF